MKSAGPTRGRPPPHLPKRLSAVDSGTMPICAACGQENPEVAKFCLACGAALAEPEPGPEEERKIVTALFTDIVGSTASAERMDPEDVRARLAPYYARVRAALESFRGTAEQFI